MAGLGFDVQEGSGFKNKQGKQPTFAEAIAGNQTAQNLVNSPAASAIGTLAKGAAAGVAALPAAAMDVSNKAGNVINYALGGDPNYFSTNNTKQALSIAGPSPSGTAVPTASAATTPPQMAVSHTQAQPIAGGIQQTGQGQQDPPQSQAIAGVRSFDFSKKQPVGGVVANNSASDWSPASVNVTNAFAGNGLGNVSGAFSADSQGAPRINSITGRASDGATITRNLDPMNNAYAQGKSYEQQVAHAKEINADTQRQLMQMSPREQAAYATMQNNGASSFMRSSAAGEIAGYESRKNALSDKFKQDNAQEIAGIGLEGHKYVADQQLAGQQANADSHVKVAQIAGDAGAIKAKQTAEAKAAEQGQKDYTDRVKSLVGDWSKLNLPKEYVPKLNDYARIFASAEDPKSNTFLMAPNRNGGMYAALPKQYESVYNKLLQTMPHNDAAARVYQIAQQKGHVMDVPDFRRFLPTSDAIKNQNQTMIAGV